MGNWFAFVFCLSTYFTTSWYICQTLVGSTRPVLATWLTFTIGSWSSLYTYIVAERKSRGEARILNNLSNVTSSIQTALVTIVLISMGVPLLENEFQKWCWAANALILAYYYRSKNAERANWAIQGVMTIAYFPTFYHLGTTSRNTESFVMWGVGGFFTALACIPPLRQRNWKAVGYAGRSAVLTGVVLYMMFRLVQRQ